jgi:hypothetical protein
VNIAQVWFALPTFIDSVPARKSVEKVRIYQEQTPNFESKYYFLKKTTNLILASQAQHSRGASHKPNSTDDSVSNG